MKNLVLASMTLLAFAMPKTSAETATPGKGIGVDLAFRDLAVKPGDDFEGYANGGWRSATEIPPDRSSIGVASSSPDPARSSRPILKPASAGNRASFCCEFTSHTVGSQ